jgi:hypothetical protein
MTQKEVDMFNQPPDMSLTETHPALSPRVRQMRVPLLQGTRLASSFLKASMSDPPLMCAVKKRASK